MTTPNDSYSLCSECSLAMGEPLAATTPHALHWLLLEYSGAWEANALTASSLPDTVKAHINAQLATVSQSRFQFIKQNGNGTREGIRLYAVRTQPGQQAVYRLDLQSYDEVLSLDLAAVFNGQSSATRSDEPLLLVCTNGKKDMACAKLGIPLAAALEAALPEQVWQSSHIGGHRFAGTLVALPDGHYYGRVGAADVPALVAALHEKRIVADYYRGCGGWTSPVQAAEIALRQRLDLWDVGAVTLDSAAPQGENEWLVSLDSDGATYPLYVTGALSEYEIQESSTDTAHKRVMQYTVEAG